MVRLLVLLTEDNGPHDTYHAVYPQPTTIHDHVEAINAAWGMGPPPADCSVSFRLGGGLTVRGGRSDGGRVSACIPGAFRNCSLTPTSVRSAWPISASPLSIRFARPSLIGGGTVAVGCLSEWYLSVVA